MISGQQKGLLKPSRINPSGEGNWTSTSQFQRWLKGGLNGGFGGVFGSFVQFICFFGFFMSFILMFYPVFLIFQFVEPLFQVPLFTSIFFSFCLKIVPF